MPEFRSQWNLPRYLSQAQLKCVKPEVVGEHARDCFEELGDLQQLEEGHDPFLIWCQVVEQSMADQIREAGILPPKLYGKFSPRAQTKAAAPRQGRYGDYQPTLATFSVVRQR